MDFSNNMSLHGALAGLAVYLVTGKPVPAILAGGGLYVYMTVYGHGLPAGGGSAPKTPVTSIEIGPIHVGPIGGMHRAMPAFGY